MSNPRNQSPERIRRRAVQEQHAVVAKAEVQGLVSPDTPEKRAAIEANTAAEVARFGEAPRAHVIQAEHRQVAQTEGAAMVLGPATRPVLEPGEQVDLNTARRMAMAHDREERDQVTVASQQAGKAVFDTLLGSNLPSIERRHKRVAEANVRAEQAQPKE